MAERFINASNGLSQSVGGMNIGEMRNIIESILNINTASTPRREMNELLKLINIDDYMNYLKPHRQIPRNNQKQKQRYEQRGEQEDEDEHKGYDPNEPSYNSSPLPERYLPQPKDFHALLAIGKANPGITNREMVKLLKMGQ
jgi:hypothetical protein